MKTEIELNNDIIGITKKIKDFFPELLKFIGEMPFKISYNNDSKIYLNNLQDYYNSLETLFKKYSLNHNTKK